MTEAPAKQALKEELVRVLAAELDTLTRALAAAHEGATHEEAKPENDKDTRALEQSYLARGQQKRLEELRLGLAAVERLVLRRFDAATPIALGALVTCEDDEGEERRLFLAPHGGGHALGAGSVQVVTPGSPLGRALLGKQHGDGCELEHAGRKRTLVVVDVA